MRLKRYKIYFPYFFLFAFITGVASCGSTFLGKAPYQSSYNLDDHEITILATIAKTDNGKTIFEGKILFKFCDQYHLSSDKLIIKSLGKNDSHNFCFDGNVEFTSESKIIKSDNALSENLKESIEFNGNPVIFENGKVQNCYRYIYFYNGTGHCIVNENDKFSANISLQATRFPRG